MEINKLTGYLNLARRADYLIIGGDSLKGYTKKLYGLFISPDASPNLKKIVYNLAEVKSIEVIEVENLGDLIKMPNCKAFGIKNLGLCQEIVKCLTKN